MSEQIVTDRVTLKVEEIRENAVGTVVTCRIVSLHDDMGSIDSDKLRRSLHGISYDGRPVIGVEMFAVMKQSIGMPVALRLGEVK